MSWLDSPLSYPATSATSVTSAGEDARFTRAARRAEIRNARAEHPELVRRRYSWWRSLITRMIWSAMVIGMAFTMQNVQHFAAVTAGHYQRADIGWWAAWLIDPAVCLVLIAVLLTENLATPEQEYLATRTHVLKWALIAVTYAMNTWQFWAAGNAAGVALHSVPVLVVLAAAEVVTDCQAVLTRTLTTILQRCQHRHDTTDRDAANTAQAEQPQQTDTVRRGADLTGHAPQTPAPIPPPAAPKFQAVPARVAPRPEFTPAVHSTHHPAGRPGEQPVTRPVEQPADHPGQQPAGRPDTGAAGRPTGRPDTAARAGPAGRSAPSRPGRGRSGRPRNEDKVVAAIREMTERNSGRPPSQYQLRQRLGIGGPRAARLLAELGPAPAAPTAGTGVATWKEHTE